LHTLPPQYLYFGVEKRKRIKLLPLPFEEVRYGKHGEYHQWYGSGDCAECKFNLEIPDSFGARIDCGYKVPDFFKPYSIRSVTSQLGMSNVIPCHYFAYAKGTDQHGNLILEEGCMESCGGCDYSYSIHDCLVTSGLTKGLASCAGLEYLKSQCQSNNERTFFELYLRMNKDREGPMPIPQCYVDPLDRYRADFVIVAESRRSSEWEWISVEIDSERFHQNASADAEKDAAVKENGFLVTRIRTEGQNSILNGVRGLFRTLELL
jgi:hypothetical protein